MFAYAVDAIRPKSYMATLPFSFAGRPGKEGGNFNVYSMSTSIDFNLGY